MSRPSNFQITAATEADIPAILRLVQALADYERMPAAVTAGETDLRRCLFGERPVAEAALAFVADEAVGVVVFFPTFSTFLGRPGIYLEDIFVLERFRGQGLGLALMRYVARQAVQRGSARFEWSVLNWNQPAIDFYERLGARPQKEWTVYRLAGLALERLAREGDE